MRLEFAKYTKELLSQNSNFSLLLGDISVGLFLNNKDCLPKNTFNMGILEQSMISFACGMSRGGITPIVHTISPFIIERAFEQIKLDIHYNQCKVIMVSANGPYDYNKLGPTHHCPSDVPMLYTLSQIKIFLPVTTNDLNFCLQKAVEQNRSSYIRLTSKSLNENYFPNTIYTKSKNLDKLNIFVGEALSLNQKKINSFENWMYIIDLDSLDKNKIEKYKNIVFWEPYSYPILANQYKYILGNKYNITSFRYPNSIEDGIYDEPNFIENKF